MTDGAALAKGFMFEGVRAALRGMTSYATLIERLRGGAAALVNGSFVGRMAVGAGDMPFGHWMVAGQVELTPNICVAGKANCLDGSRALHTINRVEARGERAPCAITVRRLWIAAALRMKA